LDRLAAEGSLGQTIPIRPGITPGSGPAHLSLFGYDPIEYIVGRGALEACGIGLSLKKGDIAVRCNFATIDEHGNITDRRAGRISNQDALPIVEKLQDITIPGVDLVVKHVKEHRFAILMQGEGLSSEIGDTDPQATGVPALPIMAQSPKAEKTAEKFRQWAAEAIKIIRDQPKANFFTMRGFATNPGLPQFKDAFGLDACCIAVYPMYRGVSNLVGMKVIEFEGETPREEFTAAKKVWQDHNFFFIHIKKTDSMGEDGNFEGKVKVIEGVDLGGRRIIKKKPDVLIITGDHSTPSKMKSHSWHPVPFLLWSPLYGLPDSQTQFGERHCALGGFGTFHATQTLPLALSHAGKLAKFGA
jgi:2,3-bisphosphoglycerate-independent phosphoglycerate mutase